MKVITDIELPQESTYKLTKKKVLRDSFFIGKGDSVTGSLDTNPIRVGSRCTVSETWTRCISTSPVVKIKVLKKKIILTTENSIYELVEVYETTDTK